MIMIWAVEDIEVAVGIILNDMMGIGNEGRKNNEIAGHTVNCYSKIEGNELKGFCVARALQKHQDGYFIAYPLFLTFKLHDNTFELHYYDVSFKFNAKDLALAVERAKMLTETKK